MNSIDLLRAKRESGYSSGSPQGLGRGNPGDSESRMLKLTEEETQACMQTYPKGGPAMLQVNGALNPDGTFEVQSVAPSEGGSPEGGDSKEPMPVRMQSQISPS